MEKLRNGALVTPTSRPLDWQGDNRLPTSGEAILENMDKHIDIENQMLFVWQI